MHFQRGMSQTVAALVSFSAAVAAAAHPASRGATERAGGTAAPVPSQDPLRQVCVTAHLPDGPHYINDHTLVQDPADGSWHLFGIFHAEPADPEHEVQFVHAVAREPRPSSWDASSFVVPAPDDPLRYALQARADLNETHIWAPHVVSDAAHGRWVMAFQASNLGGDNNAAQLKLAASPDLYHWTRLPAPGGLAFTDICVARDPMLLSPTPSSGGLWTMYYCRCDNATGQLSGVAYRTSPDLLTWSAPALALVLPRALAPPSFNSGATELPFVFARGGAVYLSVCAASEDYMRTWVFASADAHSFAPMPVATLGAHCAEYVDDGSLVTSGGWAKGGLFVSDLVWSPAATAGADSE